MAKRDQKSEICTPKRGDEHPHHFHMQVPPEGGGGHRYLDRKLNFFAVYSVSNNTCLFCHSAATILLCFVLATTLSPLLVHGQVLSNGWMVLFLCLPCSNVGSKEKPWPLH